MMDPELHQNGASLAEESPDGFLVGTDQYGHMDEHGHSEGYSPWTDLNFTPRTMLVQGGENADGDRDMAYSAYLHNFARIMNSTVGVISRGRNQLPKAKDWIEEMLALYKEDFGDEVNNRQGLWDIEEGLINTRWKKMMRSEISVFNPEFLPPPESVQDHEGNTITPAGYGVEELVDGWYNAANFLMRRKVDSVQRGLAAIMPESNNILRARDIKRKLEAFSTDLPPGHNQYFWSRLKQHQLMIDRSEDIALGIALVDYTKVKERLSRGADVHVVVNDMSWAYIEIYNKVYTSLADGDTIREQEAIMFIRQWPYDRQPPQKHGRGWFGPRESDDTGAQEFAEPFYNPGRGGNGNKGNGNGKGNGRNR